MTTNLDISRKHYLAWLEEPVDWDFHGRPILRKQTYPQETYAEIPFAAGFGMGADFGRPGYVKIPTDADEAAAMVKMGMHWLEENSPDRLTPRKPSVWQYRKMSNGDFCGEWCECNEEAYAFWSARGDNVQTRVLYDR